MKGPNMKAISEISKTILMGALMGVVLVGCNRPASDQAATTSSTPGNTASNADTSGTRRSDAAGGASSDSSGGTTTNADSSGASGTTSSSAGTLIDDSVITTKVKTALLADSDVKGTNISVETTKGEVSLTGAVDSQLQIDKAVKIASAIEGVKKVDNKVVLKK